MRTHIVGLLLLLSTPLLVCCASTGTFPEESSNNALRLQLVSLEDYPLALRTRAYLAREVQRLSTPTRVRMRVIGNEKPIALFDGRSTIIVSNGLLCFFRDEASLLFVLAHEVGHFALGHRLPEDPQNAESQRLKEFAADRYAVEKMLNLGYSPVVGLRTLEALYQRFGDEVHPGYPLLRERMDMLVRSYDVQFNTPLRASSTEFHSLQRELNC